MHSYEGTLAKAEKVIREVGSIDYLINNALPLMKVCRNEGRTV